VSLDEFVAELDRCIRKHAAFVRRLSRVQFPKDDIYSLIQAAVESGDLDEAFWRAFIAAHLGRTSANPEKPAEVISATWLLCDFGSMPVWTWKRFSTDPEAFQVWLLESSRSGNLNKLRFGNHRKYESKKPRTLWKVIESFYALVQDDYGGRPSDLFNCDDEAATPEARFRLLYDRLKPLKRFGRTARFDLLCLLLDLGLINTQPDCCCLKGATGPLAGARLIWKNQPVKELELRAADLAKKLRVSPQVLEDALCIWQKSEPGLR